MQVMLPKGKVTAFSSPDKFHKMTILGIIALISGIAGVLLTIKQNIWCWPMALVSVITSGIEFYQSKLFGDMALQVFYFVSGIYGWFFWNIKTKVLFDVSLTPRKKILPLIVFTAIQYTVYYYLLSFLKGDKIIYDAILTALSITATYMMTKKWLENWICWVAIDFAYIGLYISKELYLYAVLYFIFAIMAFAGYLNWKKKIV